MELPSAHTTILQGGRPDTPIAGGRAKRQRSAAPGYDRVTFPIPAGSQPFSPTGCASPALGNARSCVLSLQAGGPKTTISVMPESEDTIPSFDQPGSSSVHVPVLPAEVLDVLRPKPG